MTEISLISLSCKDRKPEDGHFGGWTTWEKLMQSMAEQRKKPLKERIRPCLKYRDWWIHYVPTCQECEKSTWHLLVDGKETLAKQKVRQGKRIELVIPETGEILIYTIGKGFEETESPAEAGLANYFR